MRVREREREGEREREKMVKSRLDKSHNCENRREREERKRE